MTRAGLFACGDRNTGARPWCQRRHLRLCRRGAAQDLARGAARAIVQLTGRSLRYSEFRDITAGTTDVFAGTAARWVGRFILTADGASEYVSAEVVTGSYFETLGIRPAAGRLLTTDDDVTEGSHPVCVISHALWQRRFSGDPGAIGRVIALSGERFEIVGVTARDFGGVRLNTRLDLQIPTSMIRRFGEMSRDSAGWSWLRVFARLAPGVSREQADAAVRARFARPDFEIGVIPATQGLDPLRATLEDPVLIAQLLSVCVLLIGCANVAILTLARTSSRRREIAVKLSLGATRARVVAQMLMESVVLAVAAGGLGLGLAFVLNRMVADMLFGPGADRQLEALPSVLTVGVMIATVLFCALAVGAAPAIVETRSARLDTLRESGRASTRVDWFGRALIGGQIALSLALVFAATVSPVDALRDQ